LDVNLFTAAMRTEFLRSMQAVAEPYDFEDFTEVVPSTARIENYAWMTPGPGLSRYVGHRRAAGLDQIRYSVENLEYDKTLSVPRRDVEDDQIGGYTRRVGQLAEEAGKPFQARLMMETLAKGNTLLCFDGTNFFANVHNLGGYHAVPGGFGGGGNNLTFTSTSSADGVIHKFAFMVTKNPASGLKPMLYQNRKPAKLFTDAGTPAADKAKKYDYWVDLEAAAAFGYWWDAILVTITNTPSLLDLMVCLDAARQMIRRFTLPRALPTDPLQYVHGQIKFKGNTIIVAGSTLEALFVHLLNEDRVGVSVAGSTAGITSNIYYQYSKLAVNQYFDS
jgi:phage major head subunit gpT-like protein